MVAAEKIRALAATIRRLSIQHFVTQYPRTYFGLVLFLALLGFAYLLFFPAMAIYGLLHLGHVLENSLVENSYMNSVLWYAIVIFCVGISYHIFSIRFPVPKGMPLEEKLSPELMRLVESNDSKLLSPKIHTVQLTDKFELELTKVPVFGVPLWSRNYLQIGFAFLQAMPKEYFNCALTRKLIQYAKRKHIVTNWLNQLRQIWRLYPQAFGSRNLIGDQVIHWFFRLYAPMYAKLSKHIAQKDELYADSDALELVNDLDLLKTIEHQLLVEKYLHQYYWPILADLVRQKKASAKDLFPFSTLPNALSKGLTTKNQQKWLSRLYAERGSHTSVPAFRQRMENIGHSRIKLPIVSSVPAAHAYFGPYHKKLTLLMDQQWVKKTNHKMQQLSKRVVQGGGVFA